MKKLALLSMAASFAFASAALAGEKCEKSCDKTVKTSAVSSANNKSCASACQTSAKASSCSKSAKTAKTLKKNALSIKELAAI